MARKLTVNLIDGAYINAPPNLMQINAHKKLTPVKLTRIWKIRVVQIRVDFIKR